MRLLGDGPIIDTTKNGENVPKLEIVRNVLVFCNLVQNTYLQDSKLLFPFVPNSRFGNLLSVTPQVFQTKMVGRSLQIDDDIIVSIIIKNQYG